MSAKGMMLLFIVVMSQVISTGEAVKITMHGKLVAEPCTLAPGDEKKEVFLGHIGPAFLYENGRTAGTDFTLRLENCDVSGLKAVTVTFSGTEDCELPGHLAINTTCTTRGVAIGLETAQGKFLPLLTESDSQILVNGSNAINLRAFVRASPKAIINHAIIPGAINATATFVLNYS